MTIANAHSRFAAAVLWAAHGKWDQVRHEVSKLSDDERDELLRACALVALVALVADPAEEAHARDRAALSRRSVGR